MNVGPMGKGGRFQAVAMESETSRQRKAALIWTWKEILTNGIPRHSSSPENSKFLSSNIPKDNRIAQFGNNEVTFLAITIGQKQIQVVSNRVLRLELETKFCTYNLLDLDTVPVVHEDVIRALRGTVTENTNYISAHISGAEDVSSFGPIV